MLKTVSAFSNIIGALVYKGTWDASTNNPFLQSGVGAKGDYYYVSVAGSTNLDGITDWQVGDFAAFNGTAWQKIDNTDLVQSVNGQTGIVVLTAANVGAVSNTTYVNASGLLTGGGQLTGNVTIGLTSVPAANITGLGTMATQNANAVSITGGNISVTNETAVLTTTDNVVIKTLTGYVYANNTANATASTTIPVASVSGAVPNTVNVLTSGLLSGGGALTGNVTISLTSVPSGNVTGLGTMATQNANSVTITGGTINSTTFYTANIQSVSPTFPNSYLTNSAVTIGNTSVSLGGSITSIGNLTLTNVTISNVATTFPNSFLSNSSVVIGNTSVSLGSTVTTFGNVTLNNVTINNVATTFPNSFLSNSSATIGNTTVTLGSTVSSIGNLTLAFANITSVAATFPNSYLSNSSLTIGNTSVSLGGTATSIGNLTLANVTISSGNANLNTANISYNGASSNIGSLSVGGAANITADTGLIASFVGNATTYSYVAVQNKNTGNTSYGSYSLYNELGNVYADIGMNGSTYSYTAAGFPNNAFSSPNATFIQTGGGDLAIGTNQANAIHFIANGSSSTSDAMTINANNTVTINAVGTTFPNSFLSNSSTTLGNTALTLGSTTTSVGNLTLSNVTITSGSISNIAIGAAITTKNANYNATSSDETILGNASTSNITITLPTAVGATGKTYVVKKIDSSANTVTIATTSSQTIDGTLTRVFSNQYTGAQVQTDGSNWYILAWIDGRNGTAGTF